MIGSDQVIQFLKFFLYLFIVNCISVYDQVIPAPEGILNILGMFFSRYHVFISVVRFAGEGLSLLGLLDLFKLCNATVRNIWQEWILKPRVLDLFKLCNATARIM